MDKMREEFEAWGENQYEEHWSNLCGRTKEDLFDCYRDAWQASRKAMVVTLPEVYDDDHGGHMSALSVEVALDDAGISYKHAGGA